jgi:hypothetical protein
MKLRAAVVPLIAALAVGYTANDLVSPEPSVSASTDQQLRYLKLIDRDLYYVDRSIRQLRADQRRNGLTPGDMLYRICRNTLREGVTFCER